MHRVALLKHGDAFLLHIPCASKFRNIEWFVSNVLPLAKQVPPYLCRLVQTRFLPMKCSKYITVTSFAVLNQHSLGTEFFFKVSSKYYTVEGMLSQRLIQQVEQERKWEIYRVLLILEGALPTSERMIRQLSLCGLRFHRMDFILFILLQINIYSATQSTDIPSHLHLNDTFHFSKHFHICYFIFSSLYNGWVCIRYG